MTSEPMDSGNKDTESIDPYDDLVGEGPRGRRLKIGLSVLGSLAIAWVAYFLFTGEYLFGVKTIGVVVFLFTGSLIEYRPRKSLIKRYRR